MKLISTDKSLLIKKITCVFFILGLLLSTQLWFSNRSFPTVPLFDNLFKLPNYLDLPILIGLIFLLTAMMLSKRKVFSYCLFILLIYLLITDQMRWQPWVYIYILFLLPFTLYSNYQLRSITGYFQLLLIGIYIWSGIHKLNPNFNELIVESFSVHLLKISSSSIISTIKSLGSLFALFEILAGLLLVIPKTRKIGIYLIISIHLFIILYISPLGINYNYIILPWNIFMILAVVILFYDSEENLFTWYKDKKQIVLKIVVILILSLPILNFFNRWDSYLSFSLYSGKINNYYILLANKNYPSNNQYNDFLTLENQVENGNLLDVNKWAISELNVPMVPEDRIFKKIAMKFCEKRKDRSIFITTELPLWKLMYFDFYTNPKPHMLMENTTGNLFYLKLKIPIKESNIRSFDCNYQ